MKMPLAVQAILIGLVEKKIPSVVDTIDTPRTDDKPVEFYHGLLMGYYMMVEDILMGYHAYEGYREAGIHRIYDLKRIK